jgi:hypothetical protein
LDKLSKLKVNQTLPPFTNFYDYDFRNLQAYELLEDLFWEITDSSYNHLEYLGLKKGAKVRFDFLPSHLFRESLFSKENFSKGGFSSRASKSALKLSGFKDLTFANAIFFDDPSPNPLNLATDLISYEAAPTALLNQEEGYDY